MEFWKSWKSLFSYGHLNALRGKDFPPQGDAQAERQKTNARSEVREGSPITYVILAEKLVVHVPMFPRQLGHNPNEPLQSFHINMIINFVTRRSYLIVE